MAPRTIADRPHLFEAKQEVKLRLPNEITKQVESVIKRGNYRYFTEFAVEAIKEKLKREIRNSKRKGKND